MGEVTASVQLVASLLAILATVVSFVVAIAMTRRDAQSALTLAKAALAATQQHAIRIAVLEAHQEEILESVKYIKTHMLQKVRG